MLIVPCQVMPTFKCCRIHKGFGVNRMCGGKYESSRSSSTTHCIRAVEIATFLGIETEPSQESFVLGYFTIHPFRICASVINGETHKSQHPRYRGERLEVRRVRTHIIAVSEYRRVKSYRLYCQHDVPNERF